jgi:hypothetical protein
MPRGAESREAALVALAPTLPLLLLLLATRPSTPVALVPTPEELPLPWVMAMADRLRAATSVRAAAKPSRKEGGELHTPTPPLVLPPPNFRHISSRRLMEEEEAPLGSEGRSMVVKAAALVVP